MDQHGKRIQELHGPYTLLLKTGAKISIFGGLLLYARAFIFQVRCLTTAMRLGVTLTKAGRCLRLPVFSLLLRVDPALASAWVRWLYFFLSLCDHVYGIKH